MGLEKSWVHNDNMIINLNTWKNEVTIKTEGRTVLGKYQRSFGCFEVSIK